MIAEQAAQCGYCYNGQIIKGAELLFRTPQPSEAQIRSAMNGHICRCGTYPADHGGNSASGAKRWRRTGLRPPARRRRWPMSERDDDRLVLASPRVSEDDRRRRRRASVSPAECAGKRRRRRSAGRAAAARCRVRPIRTRSIPTSRSTPTTPRRIYSGYVELGQGGPTALRQIAAEELDLEFEQVKTATVDTFVSTNGFTCGRAGRAAIGGTETRAAAAEARRVLLELASRAARRGRRGSDGGQGRRVGR